MERVQFKTNINCGSCVRAVTGFLADVPNINDWKVDTENPDKMLTVEGNDVRVKEITDAVEEAGFNIQLLPQQQLS